MSHYALITLLLYVFATIFLSIIIICLILYVTSDPYPTVIRSKKEQVFKTGKDDETEPFPSVDDPCSVNLSIVVPAYNEQKRLPPMLDECLSFLEDRQKNTKEFTYEVIIVSDGSYDQTVSVGLDYTQRYGSDKVRVLELQPNRGKGGAVQVGVQSSRGAVILFADADGATKFDDLVKLEAALKDITKEDYLSQRDKVSEMDGMVCGSRSHLEDEALAQRSVFRNFLMYGFHMLVWAFAVRTVGDTQCGFKLFTRQTARTTFSNLHVQRWAFDVELLHIVEVLEIPLKEVCVNWTEVDGSKIIPILSWIQMGKDLIMIWLRYTSGAWKIKPKVQ